MSLAGLLPRSATVDGSVRLDGHRADRRRQDATLRADPRPRDRVHLPGADDLAEPGPHRRPADRRGARRSTSGLSRQAAQERAVELLKLVGIPSAEQRVGDYPHQLSGGMRQRVMIAMAVACEPEGADRRRADHRARRHVQAGILDVLRDLRDRLGTSILLITHDLGVIADVADRVVVMYAGRVVETGRCRRAVRPPAAPLHRRAAVGAHRRPAVTPARTGCSEIPGLVPGPQRTARRLHVRRPLPGRRPSTCPTPPAAAADGRRGARGPHATTGGLLAPGRCAGTAWRQPLTDVRRASDEATPASSAGDGRTTSSSSSRTSSCTSGRSGPSTGCRCRSAQGPGHRPGRRERLRQVDGRPVHRAPARADRRAPSGSPAPTSPTCPAASCARTGATCPSSSRTRPARSTRGCWSATSSAEPLRLQPAGCPGKTSQAKVAEAARAGSDCGLRSPGATRTSCPAVSASGSASPGH